MDEILRPLFYRNQNADDLEIGVKKILQDVKENKDEALLRYTKEFDGVDLSDRGFFVTKEELETAISEVDTTLIDYIKKVISYMQSYHSSHMPISWIKEGDDYQLGQKITPIQSVACYVPGGSAPLVSSILMTVVPARIAGVKNICVVTPPKQGGILKEMIVAAHMAGANSICTLGGAQAIGAFAYGTESIPKVDKIVGPGNIFVTLAKKQVFGTVGIDMLAGPSEILIIADKTANPRYIAADLLGQSEHDPLSAAILLCDSQSIIDEVEKELAKQLAQLERKEIASKSIRNFGLLIKVASMEEAVQLSNKIAPEHLEIMTKNPHELLDDIENAGAIFLGEYTTESLGDYVAGPSHVIPTAGGARFSSPIGVDTFLKKSSILSYQKEKLKSLEPIISYFADIEELSAHKKSVQIRLEDAL